MEDDVVLPLGVRPKPLASRLSEEESAAHGTMVQKMGDKAIWAKYGG
jgi:DNA polymerase-3 subunit epsilon